SGRPAPAPFLEPAEEVEEQRDGPVGAGDERDGARVVPRPVDGERRVAGQRREAELGQGAVAGKVHGREAEAEHVLGGWAITGSCDRGCFPYAPEFNDQHVSTAPFIGGIGFEKGG